MTTVFINGCLQLRVQSRHHTGVPFSFFPLKEKTLKRGKCNVSIQRFNNSKIQRFQYFVQSKYFSILNSQNPIPNTQYLNLLLPFKSQLLLRLAVCVLSILRFAFTRFFGVRLLWIIAFSFPWLSWFIRIRFL